MISQHWGIRLNPYNLRNFTPVSFTGAFHQPLVETVQTLECEALSVFLRLVSLNHNYNP
ncbi:MAG: hypothetical protein RM022_016410 [Nostoc sp. EfeVER01]|uniref:hypothetical protein n=1 Tax=unclassified Nostoc TaxID=2593658 RepID=UPI00391D03D4